MKITYTYFKQKLHLFYIHVIEIISARLVRSTKSFSRTLHGTSIVTKIWNHMKLHSQKIKIKKKKNPKKNIQYELRKQLKRSKRYFSVFSDVPTVSKRKNKWQKIQEWTNMCGLCWKVQCFHKKNSWVSRPAYYQRRDNPWLEEARAS